MITTLEKVKVILQITTAEKDNLINELIPLVEDDYRAIRNKAFDIDSGGNTIYPAGAEMTAIKMIDYLMTNKPTGIKSESVSRYSVTYEDTDRIYPESITKKIKRVVSFA